MVGTGDVNASHSMLTPLAFFRSADTREQKDFKAALGFRVLRQSIADELDLSRMSSPDDSPAVSTL